MDMVRIIQLLVRCAILCTLHQFVNTQGHIHKNESAQQRIDVHIGTQLRTLILGGSHSTPRKSDRGFDVDYKVEFLFASCLS